MQELSEVVGETANQLAITSKGVNTILRALEYLSKKSKRILDRIEQRLIDGNLFKVF